MTKKKYKKRKPKNTTTETPVIINTQKIRKGQIIPNYRAFCRLLGEPINTNQIEINKQLQQWSELISFTKIPNSNKFLVESVNKNLYSITEETSELDGYVRHDNRRVNLKTDFLERFHLISVIKIYILMYLLQCPEEEVICSSVKILHELGEKFIDTPYSNALLSDIFNYNLDSIHLPNVPQKVLKMKRLVEIALSDLYQDKVIFTQDIMIINNRPATHKEMVSLLGIEKNLLVKYKAYNLSALVKRHEYIEDYYSELVTKAQEVDINNFYRGISITFNRTELFFYLGKIICHANDQLAVKKYNKVLFSCPEDVKLFQDRVVCDLSLKHLSKEYETCASFGFMQQHGMLRSLKRKVPISEVSLTYIYRCSELLREYLLLVEDIV